VASVGGRRSGPDDDPLTADFADQADGRGKGLRSCIRAISAIHGKSNSSLFASLRLCVRPLRWTLKPGQSTTSLRDFLVERGRHSEWTTAASSGYIFSKFFKEFPCPLKIQADFLHLSSEQREADLNRPTHSGINKIGRVRRQKLHRPRARAGGIGHCRPQEFKPRPAPRNNYRTPLASPGRRTPPMAKCKV